MEKGSRFWSWVNGLEFVWQTFSVGMLICTFPWLYHMRGEIRLLHAEVKELSEQTERYSSSAERSRDEARNFLDLAKLAKEVAEESNGRTESDLMRMQEVQYKVEKDHAVIDQALSDWGRIHQPRSELEVWPETGPQMQAAPVIPALSAESPETHATINLNPFLNFQCIIVSPDDCTPQPPNLPEGIALTH